LINFEQVHKNSKTQLYCVQFKWNRI